MKRLDETEIASALVCELYCLYAEDAIEPGEKVRFVDLLEKCRAVLDGQSLIGRNLSKLALGEAERQRHIDVTDYPFDDDETELVVTRAGLQFVSEARSNGYEPVISYLSYRQNFVPPVKVLESPEEADVVVAHDAEDAWAPLPLDRTSLGYEEAVRSLEKVRDEFRGENGFASESPEKKLAILETLNHGIEVLKTKVITAITLDTLLFQPLKFILKTFGTASVGEAAKLAIAALKNLFGP